MEINASTCECEYCGKNIENGNEFKRDFIVPGIQGTQHKNFCCDKCANSYKQELDEKQKRPVNSGGGCCG